MIQQLQLGKYEFFPYYDQRNQLPEITTEEMLDYLKSRLGKSKKNRKVRRQLATSPMKGR